MAWGGRSITGKPWPPSVAATRAPFILLAVLLTISPSIAAHGSDALELIARDGEDCLGAAEVCLEVFSIPPDLEPGHATVLELRNHANSSTSFTAALTVPDQADPDREATPASAAIATTGSVEPGERGHVNLTLPDTSHAYAWLTGEDTETRGGWEMVPLSLDAQDPSSDEARAAPSLPLATTMMLLALVAVWRRENP